MRRQNNETKNLLFIHDSINPYHVRGISPSLVVGDISMNICPACSDGFLVDNECTTCLTKFVPKGYYCYDENGRCPYFKTTDYGTVRCEKMDIESLTIQAGENHCKLREMAYNHFGSHEKTWDLMDSDLLWDMVKECWENM